MKQWVQRGLDTVHRRRFSILMACIVVFVIADSLKNREYVLPGVGERVSVTQPRLRAGHMFVATLSRTDLGIANAPVDAVLYEITTRRGAAAFESIDDSLGWSTAYHAVRSLVLNKYPTFAIEKRRALGPGGQKLEVIESAGNGRYRVLDGLLYFSASDNSSAALNGRRYELVMVVAAVRVIARFGSFASLALFGTLIVVSLRRYPVARQLFFNIAPGVANTVILLALIVGAYELYQRFNGRFATTAWPSVVDPVAGTLFEPNADVRWTNHLDFWVAERTNSIGFLDGEPTLPKPPGRFRILVIGDSFVEAAQVRTVDKLQTILAKKLQERLGDENVDVVAFGSSGTGQANQLSFYEKYGNAVAPDLVVLLLVANDFANNSPILEAVRNGWAPYRPPRLFYERDGDVFRRISIDPEWLRQRLPGEVTSDFYAALMKDPAIAPRLAGWGGPADNDIDEMFWHRSLPPVFEDALILTGHAIHRWKSIGEADGFRVVLVGTEGLTYSGSDETRDGALQLARFRDIATAEGLPLLDLRPEFVTRGDVDSAHWPTDAHWNEQGHRWAAEAVFEFLVANALVPAPTNGT